MNIREPEATQRVEQPYDDHMQAQETCEQEEDASRRKTRCSSSNTSLPYVISHDTTHVAIVGAGPTGMSAAYDLVRRGHRVTLIDALPMVGGMLAAGVPRDLVPRRELNRDARLLSRLGVDIRLRQRIGQNLSLAGLRRQVDAVLLAIGSQQDAQLFLPGERELAGVVPALTFLKQHNLTQQKIPLEGDTVVIGSGRSAIFAARTALRAGALPVHLMTPGPVALMTASPEAIHAARQEGVLFHEFLAPLALLGQGSTTVQTVRCQRMQFSEPDGNGRRFLKSVPGTQYRLPANQVVIAAGEEPDYSSVFPFSSPSSEIAKKGIPKGQMTTGDQKAYSYTTNIPDVFVAGGMLFGPGSVDLAISEGQRVARAIHSMLREIPEEALDHLPTGVLHLSSLR